VPLGALAFLPGELEPAARERALVLLGDNWFADMRLTEARALLQRRSGVGRAEPAADSSLVVSLVEEYDAQGNLVSTSLPRAPTTTTTDTAAAAPPPLPVVVDHSELLARLAYYGELERQELERQEVVPPAAEPARPSPAQPSPVAAHVRERAPPARPSPVAAHVRERASPARPSPVAPVVLERASPVRPSPGAPQRALPAAPVVTAEKIDLAPRPPRVLAVRERAPAAPPAPPAPNAVNEFAGDSRDEVVLDQPHDDYDDDDDDAVDMDEIAQELEILRQRHAARAATGDPLAPPSQ
jgi:hypothetical protein